MSEVRPVGRGFVARGALAAAFAMLALPLFAQTPPAAPSADAGFPIQNELVKSRCGGCHRSDDKGRMSRISYRRATPENWERTIKRMVTLNNAKLEPADARAILKYLSDTQGLAPEEARPIAFEAERRMIDFSYTADKETSDLCSSCHSIARVMSERRNKDEWDLLLAMHRGYYPLVDNQPMNTGGGFRRQRLQTEPGADGRPPDNRQPMDRAVEHLSKTFPLTTPEWSGWAAAMQTPKLAGRWAIVGTQAGKGGVYGEMTIAVDPSSPDSFTTNTRLTIARTGEAVTRSGRGLVYTGYEWRGRSPSGNQAWREVMFVERDWKSMWGRWYTGDYDEIGVDVKLVRLTNEPVIFGTSASALKTATAGQSIHILGANLPTDVKAGDIGLGRGVAITGVTSARADEIVIDVSVDKAAPIGARDLSVAGTVKPSALVVYDTIDRIKVTPLSGMARVGGTVFPKQVQQFDAIGFNNGPDGKPDTADDLDLGVVPVSWSVEEYTATFGDDDAQFVGTIDENGLFTPAVDGPNPKRSGNRNNVGDVWVVAELKNPASASAKALRGRAHLLVTVPLYMAWFQDGGGK